MHKFNLSIFLIIGSQLVACQNEPQTDRIETRQVEKRQDKTQATGIDTQQLAGEQAANKKQGEMVKQAAEKLHHWTNAQIKYMDLEGGFYGIITDRGIKLLPANLAKEFRQDGAIVELSGYFEEGVITFQQWGKPFKIVSIKLISKGSYTPKSER